MGTSIKDWSKINKASILNDRSLLLEFTNDFQNTFNERLNVGCNNCITDAYNRLVSKNSKPMEVKKDKECEYVLHGKYSGMIYKSQPVRRGEMTDKLAKDLIKNHPLGKGLFEKLPTVKKAPKKAEKKEVKTDK